MDVRMVVPDSLAATLDAVNEALFWGAALDAEVRTQTAIWIAGRQGKPGSYWGLCAPTGWDFESEVRVFTGERLTSRVGRAHILGEEASRLLALLKVDLPEVRAAQEAAQQAMLSRIQYAEACGETGTYCCGLCTPAYWRNLAAGGLGDAEARLTAGVRALKTYRLGDGRWRRFSFYYTVLALSEMDLPEAVEELRYASRSLERTARSEAAEDRYAQRRKALAERVLIRL